MEPTPLEQVIGPRKRDALEPRTETVRAEPTVAAKPEPRDEPREKPQTETVAPTGVAASAPDDDSSDDIEPGESGLKKALVAERKLRREERKRVQELQRQLEQLSSHVTAAREVPQQQTPAQDPTEAANRDFDEFLARGPQWTRQAIDARVRELKTAATVEKIEDAEAEFAEKHPDAPEMFKRFQSLAANDPNLRARFAAVAERRDPAYRNPAKFAYDYAKAYAEASEMGDPASYRERLRKEIMDEIEKGGGATSAHPREAPKTLAGARGSGAAGSSTRFSGPTPIEDIVGPRKKAQR